MEWNGHDRKNPVMDFKFIEKQYVKIVISCKSNIRPGLIDKEYPKLMRKYAKDIWLFSECCDPKKSEKIKKEAYKYGYKRFWYLYGLTSSDDADPNKTGWIKFASEIKKLKLIESN